MPLAHQSVGFSLLQKRLLDYIRQQLSNGELTERRLARVIGVSQPHMHNVLKGVRALTPEVADLCLAGLGISVLDLVETREVEALLLARQYEGERSSLAPVLGGRISPEDPFPKMPGAVDWCQLPPWLCAGRRRLVFMRAGRDGGSPLAPEDEFLLVSVEEEARLRVDARQVAVLRWRGAGFLRRVERRGRRLLVLGQDNWLESGAPGEIDLEDQSLLSVVRGVVVWAGRDFRGHSPLDYMGSFLEKPASR